MRVLERGEALGAGNLIVRRDLYLEMGGFAERIAIYSEEVEFLGRMYDRGWRFVYTPEATVDHVISGSRSSRVGLWRRSFRQGEGVLQARAPHEQPNLAVVFLSLAKAAGRLLLSRRFENEFGIMYYLGALSALLRPST